MAYDSSKVAGGKGNFSLNQNFDVEGVDVTLLTVDFITVDYINDVSGEITHSTASANTAALKLSIEAIQNQGVNVLGMGA